MKFLGIRNGHDCNFTYTDGKTVKYIKLERDVQIKHYHWYLYDKIGQDMPHLLGMAARILKFNLNELDAICIGLDPANHTLDRSIQPDELYYEVDSNKTQFWQGFPCPIYSIDHHYAHALSNWPLVDIHNANANFVFDGSGDHKRSSSIFDCNKLVDCSDYSENAGISRILEILGQNCGIEGLVLDISGKLMALQSFHNLSTENVSVILEQSKGLHYREMHAFMDIVLGNAKDLTRKSKQDLINAAYLLHEFAKDKLPVYLSQFVQDDDTFTYSGGSAQNTVVNSVLRQRFRNIVIPPHCPDDGISLGCVELLRQIYDQEPFDNSGFPFIQQDEAPESIPTLQTIDRTAELLAQGKIVGWYQGHGEIGPRALGNRSILMDPSVKGGKDIINSKVKRREPYRPFGASILLDDAKTFFDNAEHSPYMLYNYNCKHATEFNSIVHVDGTCRIQTVDQAPQNEVYYTLIDKFKSKTGIPMLLNTSLNVNGKPIAGHVNDAKTLFNNSELDVLVIGDEIITK